MNPYNPSKTKEDQFHSGYMVPYQRQSPLDIPPRYAPLPGINPLRSMSLPNSFNSEPNDNVFLGRSDPIPFRQLPNEPLYHPSYPEDEYESENSYSLQESGESYSYSYSYSSSPQEPLTVPPQPVPYPQHQHVNVIVAVSSENLTRAQWYTMSVRFANAQGRPLFSGRDVSIHPSVSFEDCRKRALTSKGNVQDKLYLTVFGSCAATGKQIFKCQKCREQDKVTTNRKRRRDTQDWTELDAENNNKLCQVLETGGIVVDKEGAINIKFRIMCCVGATRQFHKNHEGGEGGDTHRGCQGLTLTVGLNDYNSVLNVSGSLPYSIRVVGKAKATGTQKGEEKEKMSLVVSQSQSQPQPQSQSYPPAKKFKFPPKEESSIQIAMLTPPSYPQTYSYKSYSRDDQLNFAQSLYRFLGKDVNDFKSLHHSVKTYLDAIKAEFQMSYRAVFEPDFFSVNNLATIPMESPQMLHVFNVLSMVDFLKKGGKRVQILTSNVHRIRDKLLKTMSIPDIPYYEGLLFCDAVTRSSVFYVYSGDFNSARRVINEAYNLYDLLAINQPQVKKTDYYAFLMWHKSYLFYTIPEILQVYTWASVYNHHPIQTRSLVSEIVAICFPDFATNPDIVPVRPLPGFTVAQRTTLLPLIDLLEKSIFSAGYARYNDGDSSCASSADFAIAAIKALRSWVMWDLSGALSQIEECATLAPLVANYKDDTIILNISSLVAIQLVGLKIQNPSSLPSDISTCINYAELLLKFSKMALMIQGRVLDVTNELMLFNFTNKVTNREIQ